ncbi:MAG: SCO family protein [Planctomycetes bacterium]|nr:SCO family protein [Planctomycetota bacterium]
MNLRKATLLVSLIAAAALAHSAFAQRPLDAHGYEPRAQFTDAPKELDGLEVKDQRGARLPMEAALFDESGKAITLAELFADGKPKLVQLGYMKCPMLCSLVLNGLVKGMQGLDWSAGEQYDVLFFSINPDETFELAAAKRKGYAVEYGRAGGEKGWRFLTGSEASVRSIAEAVGFPYRKMENGEYAHPAAVFAVTGDGRLAQYLPGVAPTPSDLRLALTGAGEGQLGSTFDQFVFWCHNFDPAKGSYAWHAYRIMQIAGLFTVLALGAVVWILFRSEARAKRLAAPFLGATAPTNRVPGALPTP